MIKRRKDDKGRVLKANEYQKSNGAYEYRWRDNGSYHSVYAANLKDLREKEIKIIKDREDGIRTDINKITLNDIYNIWENVKRGLKDNTFQNYKYMYNQFVRSEIGESKISVLKKSDIRRFYNSLIDNRGLKVATVDSIHNIIHQIIELAVEDGYLRQNVCDNALKELKASRQFDNKKRKALSSRETELLLDFLDKSSTYSHWYPIISVMLGTGMRVGEITGLRWQDIDFENNYISVNHTLVYYNHVHGGCYFGINTPKTKAGERTIPMIESVREALLREKEYQRECGITSKSQIDGMKDFVFVNRYGTVQNQSTLNRAIRRIVRDCNQQIFDKSNNYRNLILLPKFSCHTLRHTFTTRLCESGINIKVIQSVLGHSDVSTTLDIYADCTKELKQRELDKFDDFIKKQ